MTTAARNIPAPAPFKPAWDDPEKNYLLFDTWVKQMRHYFRLTRNRNADGEPVEWPGEEMMSLALITGGQEIRTLFETVAAQDVDDVEFEAAVTAARTALSARMNETSQVYNLNKMEQGDRSFGEWYPGVLEAAQRINWADYNSEMAAKNVMIFNCASEKLRKKAIAENLSYNDFIKTALAMENSETKTKSMAAGEGIRSITTEEEVRKLKDQVRKLQGKPGAGKSGKGKVKCKTCGRQPHPSGQTCFALELTCHKCNKIGHLQTVC